MLSLYGFLLGIRLLHAHNCPGWCGHPLEKLVIWTDNPNIWRCELPSITVTRCSDVATVECLRLDDLGGDLYLMLFADSPNVIGIDPEYLAKGRSDVLKTKIHCKNGIWTLPDSHIRMTHLLCDQYIIDKHKALNSKNKPLPPITTAKPLPLPDDGLTVSDKESTVAKKDLTDSLSGGYPLAPVPEVPNTAGGNSYKPPQGSSETYTYTIPNSTTSKSPSIVEVNTKKPPGGAYLLPDPPATITTTSEPTTTQSSPASTTYTVGTVTAILSLTTSSPTTTAVTPSTTKLLTTTSTSTVTSPSTTSTVPSPSTTSTVTSPSTTSTVTNPSTTATSTTGTTAGRSSLPNLTTNVSPKTTPRPVSTTTTTPFIPMTTTSTTTTMKPPSTPSAAVPQTTNSTTSPKHTTEEERITSVTPHQATKVTTNPTTSQTTISTTFSTTSKALETTTTSKPFVKVSFTYRENNSPAVDPYGDDTIEVVKPKPHRTWSRDEPKTVKRKASEPPVLVKVGNKKPMTFKNIPVERPTKPIRARPLRKEAPRNFQKKVIRPKGKLVVLGAGKRTTQQRKPQQVV